MHHGPSMDQSPVHTQYTHTRAPTDTRTHLHIFANMVADIWFYCPSTSIKTKWILLRLLLNYFSVSGRQSNASHAPLTTATTNGNNGSNVSSSSSRINVWKERRLGKIRNRPSWIFVFGCHARHRLHIIHTNINIVDPIEQIKNT